MWFTREKAEPATVETAPPTPEEKLTQARARLHETEAEYNQALRNYLEVIAEAKRMDYVHVQKQKAFHAAQRALANALAECGLIH